MTKKLDDVLTALPKERQRRIEARALELALPAAQDYEAFLRGKVEAARLSVQAGDGQPAAEVEAFFAARRAALKP
ncbi:MAG: hypothetical protein K0Q68_2170 [Moraxellaceae bacterium]|jgi:hypothetical protein|nr:hypothetical protein [Moraxellaceae bacterium]